MAGRVEDDPDPVLIPIRNERLFTSRNSSYIACSWRKVFATLIPLIVSWMCELTSAETRRCWVVVSRAILRKNKSIAWIAVVPS